MRAALLAAVALFAAPLAAGEQAKAPAPLPGPTPKVLNAYRDKVRAQVNRNAFYPETARMENLTGIVTVRFTVKGDGGVTVAKVTQSSGYEVLDEAAVSMILRAGPYPPLPPELGKTLTMIWPMQFRLVEDRGQAHLLK